MPEPSREAREVCFCIPCAKSLGKRANGSHAPDECIARALDDFAEKWREEAERRNVAAGEASAKFLEEHRQRVKAEQERDALRRDRDDWKARFTQWNDAKCSVEEHIFAVSERDALRRRVSDLQRRVDHCECESLIDHVRDCLPEYEHDDNVHGESEPFNEIETIEEAGREIDALRRRVAELKDVCVPCKRPAVYCICKLEHDVLVAEGRAEAAEKALAKYGGHDTLCTVAGGYDAPCDCGLEKARRARGEGK